MAKYLISGYTFNPGASGSGTITVDGTFPLEQFLLATNVTRNKIIYQFNSPSLGGSVTYSSGTTSLFLKADTSAMNAADKVQLFVDDGAGLLVEPENIATKFRDSFESFTPGTRWTLSSGTSDIIAIDGNTAGSTYLVISKDPLTAGSETTLETISTFETPLEASIGLSLSQRVLGQEFSAEIVSVDTSSIPSELTISSISQSTTTLTVNTSTNHGLVPGRRVGIYGVSDSRFNYPSLVVASIPSSTQFTCTAGPGGTIPSVTAGPFTSGFVYHRSSMGFARDGISQVFENATATNSSFYTRSNSGEVFPGGTANGNHSTTIATTTGTQIINTPFAYAWLPASEYRYTIQADRAQFQDVSVDSVAAMSSRLFKTQALPSSNKKYELRFRFRNNKGLTIPTAQIVSAVKAGSTTATITTSTPHGLTTGDQIVIYGIRDQTNFANLTTATAVASTPTSTSFTIAFGASATATSYGGMVSRVQGGNIPASYTTIAIQSAANDGTALTLVGSGTWTWLVGDYVNVYGCRDNTTGASLNVDGAYKVASVSTTTMILLPIGSTVLPSVFTTTNAGGTVIKRTDARINFVRIFSYLRERVEIQVNSATAAAVPTQIVNVPSAAQSGTWSVNQAGTWTVTQSGAWNVGLTIPTIVADVASAALTTTTTTSAITPALGTAYSVNIPVTATSGTNQTLDVSIEESDDSGTNWFKVYDFPRITATGMYRSPIIRLTGNRIRYVQTVGGSSPSFTRSVNRLQSSSSNEPIRQLIDRTISLTTLNSTTPNLDVRDTGNRMQLVVNVGAITTTAPILQLEGSDDNGASWYAIGSPLTAVASSTVQITIVDINTALVRARVSTAGVGVTAGYVMIKAHD